MSNVTITRDEKETRNAGVENFLLHRMDPKIHTLDDNGKRFYGMSLGRISEELVGVRGLSAIQYATRSLSTSDLPEILGNVLDKSMRQSYQAQPASFKSRTKAGLLDNYRAHNRLLVSDFPNLEEVSEGGEIKNGAISESKEVIRLKRYAKKLMFTKEMIVNDSMSVLSDFGSKGSQAAVRLESGLVYDLLLENPEMGDTEDLFSTAHANIAASGTVISIDSINLGWQAIANQRTLDGLDYADLIPKYIIVGTANKAKADQFVSVNLLASASSSVNPFAGNLTVICDPRVSGTKWYLSGEPSQCDTFEVARLNGENGPLITVEKGRNAGSIEITTEHSCGVSALDHRNLYYNAGS